MPCIFCSQEIQKHFVKIFEDEKVFVIMDHEPVNPGHVLILPKKHIPSFQNTDMDLFQHIMNLTHTMGKIIKKAFKCKKVGVLIAGFDVPHLHIHIIPMSDIKDVSTRRMWEDSNFRVNKSDLKFHRDTILDIMKENKINLAK